MSDAFCGIFEDSPAGRTFSIPTADTFEAWNNASLSREGPDDLIIADIANNRVMVQTNGKGTYQVSIVTHFGASKPSLVTGSVFLNGVSQPNLSLYREIGTPNDVGSATIIDFLDLEPGDELTLRYKTDKMNNDVIIFHVNVTVSSVVRAIVPTE